MPASPCGDNSGSVMESYIEYPACVCVCVTQRARRETSRRRLRVQEVLRVLDSLHISFSTGTQLQVDPQVLSRTLFDTPTKPLEHAQEYCCRS